MGATRGYDPTWVPWMQTMWEHIKDREPWRIVLPATHNSGSFANFPPEIAANLPAFHDRFPYVQCQSADIADQLMMGVRGFDLRIIGSGGDPESLYFHHNGLVPDPARQRVDTGLAQLRDFVRRYDHEVLVLQFSQQGLDSGTNRTPHLRELILDYLGKHVILSDAPNFTLESLKASGGSVILLQNNSIYGRQPEFWPVDRLHTSYQGWQSDPSKTFYMLPSQVMANVQTAIGDDLDVKLPDLRPGVFRSSATYGLFTLGDVLAWAVQVHLSIDSWIKDWAADAGASSRLNMVEFDFVKPELVAKIIALNERQARRSREWDMTGPPADY